MSTPSAAWYPSPGEDHLERWWDGTSWTALTRPAGSTAELATQRTSSASAKKLVGATSQMPAPKPQNAIVVRAAQPHPAARPAVRSSVPRTFPAQRSTPDTGPAQPLSGSVGTDVPDGASGSRRRSRAIASLVVGLVLLVAGTVASMAAGGGANRVKAGEATVAGTVFRHDAQATADGGTRCSPAAAFTIGSRTYRAEAGPSSPCLKIGTSVTVIYTVADPGDAHARIRQPAPYRRLIWLVPATGLALTTAGVVTLRAGRRRAEPTA
ncbi:DUF2510 domain-containing protein [Cellulomonas sp. URHD0024]|uniref:DUF2510 domain-containing protein n=1 Tax=Cellulomonas sp. URHD0024 TaxID=1302620 RepID=UPI00040542A6|nr:DUF2510 domain-containing protein [Cellulomonas sp. URHD0024]